jgi:hypothetical protein
MAHRSDVSTPGWSSDSTRSFRSFSIETRNNRYSRHVVSSDRPSAESVVTTVAAQAERLVAPVDTRDAVIYRAYERHLVACAKRVDTTLSFCRFDGLVGEGENSMHDPSSPRLRLFPRNRSNSSFRSTSGVDELARGDWTCGLLRRVFGTSALEKLTSPD